MCGIAGVWSDPKAPAGPDLSQALAAALTAIVHRGPDDSGVLIDGSLAIGMRRLSIIDVAGGHQPVSNEDGSVSVVFNGEIYNYRELMEDLAARGHVFRTSSDTEVLVHLYEEEGPALFKKLRGMYAVALWDARRRRLLLGRDRLGKKPLYYARTSTGGIIFASELKALKPLAKATDQPLRVRDQGVYDYLSLGVVPQPSTIFDGVLALPPASYLLLDADRADIQSYWSVAYGPKRNLPYRDALAATRDLVADSVRLRLRSDVPLGVFLSGGVDSTVVAFEAARHVGPALQTFTVGVDNAALDESSVAARTARAFGVKNSVLRLSVAPREDLLALVRHYDQPYADGSAIPSMAIARVARQQVTVVLNGDGGDEVFAGYRRHMAAHLLSAILLAPLSMRKAVASAAVRAAPLFKRRSGLGFAARLLRGIAMSPGERYLAWTSDMLRQSDKARLWLGGTVEATEDWVASNLPAVECALDVQLGGDLRINLLSDLLVKMDMATMAASLEARSPLLDHNLVEFTAALPAGHRLRGGRTKALLRDAYQGLVPDEVLHAPKRGFEIPLEQWLAGPLRDLLFDMVGTSGARIRRYVDGEYLNVVLRPNTRDAGNRACLLYALLLLEMWLREFEDRR